MGKYNGGYKIISLLSPTIYEDIESNILKPLLLTDIKINDNEKNDLFSFVTIEGTDFLFQNVYDKNVRVTEDNVVSYEESSISVAIEKSNNSFQIDNNTYSFDRVPVQKFNSLSQAMIAITPSSKPLSIAYRDRTGQFMTMTNKITNDYYVTTGKAVIDYAQPKLTAGSGITIEDNVISATGGGSSNISVNLSNLDSSFNNTLFTLILNDNSTQALTIESTMTLENVKCINMEFYSQTINITKGFAIIIFNNKSYIFSDTINNNLTLTASDDSSYFTLIPLTDINIEFMLGQ